MRIDDSFSASSDLITPGVDRVDQVQQETSRRQRRQEPTDTASLSALAAELAKQIQTDPPDVVARIEELREAVKAGTYEEPAIEVAQAIVDEALAAAEPVPTRDETVVAAGIAEQGRTP